MKHVQTTIPNWEVLGLKLSKRVTPIPVSMHHSDASQTAPIPGWMRHRTAVVAGADFSGRWIAKKWTYDGRLWMIMDDYHLFFQMSE